MQETISCAAELGGVSFSKKGVVKVGVSVERDNLDLAVADKFFSGVDLRAEFTIGESAGDIPGTPTETLGLDCVANGYSVKPDHYSVSLAIVGKIESLTKLVAFGGHEVMAKFTKED